MQRLAALQKLWREPRGLCKGLFVRRKKKGGRTSRAGGYAKGACAGSMRNAFDRPSRCSL